MTKATVCHVSPLSIHVYRWMKAFVQRGYNISLISDSRAWVAPKPKSIQVYALPTLRKTNFAQQFIPNSLKIVRILERINPDFIHLHVQHHYSLPIILTRHPYILTSWGVEVLSLPDADILIRSVARMTSMKAHRIIVDAHCLKDIWIRTGVPQHKIEVIPFGVDLNIFNPDVDGSNVRRKLGIKENDTVIISTRALFNNHYNIECLLHSIPIVLEKCGNVKFIIKGAGPLESQLRNLVDALGVSEHVRFVGLVSHPEVAQYLAASDIYVSTPFIDSTSVSLLEAMACGLAPIVTDILGNREWIENGTNGFLFPPRNSQMLAEKIIQLIENKDARKRFGERCIRIVRQKASWENCVDRMEAIYQSLL
ncbi:MAG: glycosyltransferase family 1 protein [Candidatus Bathyarchaeum sp.]|nr:MAG: glycosyltransferase family 1 protein [Candidatus Bathyarchaeum sp.]